MQNYVQAGKTITLTAPYAVSSGDGALVDSIFGVAIADVANAASGEFQTCGVFTLTSLGTATFDQGAKVYWDDTNKRVTNSASGNYKIGVATVAKASGPTTATVRLDGIALTAEA